MRDTVLIDTTNAFSIRSATSEALQRLGIEKPRSPRRQHQLRAFLADHDAGGVGVAGHHGRHDRGVGDA